MLSGRGGGLAPTRPRHRVPERRGSLIFGDGGQFPNLFFYNSSAREACGPFSATFETHKAAGAAGDDRGFVSYTKGVNEPATAGTRACSAARRSLSIQIYGAAVLEDPVLGAEQGNTKPRGITVCIVTTARRQNEQISDFSGPCKSTSRVITTFHDFADPSVTLRSKFASRAARRRTTEWGNCANRTKTGGSGASSLMLIRLFQQTTICWGLGLKRQVRKVHRIPDAVVRGRDA